MSQTPFDPSDFYDLAVALPSLDAREASLRTAISRAYYACFHLARLGCQRKWSWTPPPFGEHRSVIRKLREQRVLQLAAALQTLLDLREHADYDLATPIDAATCNHALDLAAGLVPRLRSL